MSLRLVSSLPSGVTSPPACRVYTKGSSFRGFVPFDDETRFGFVDVAAPNLLRPDVLILKSLCETTREKDTSRGYYVKFPRRRKRKRERETIMDFHASIQEILNCKLAQSARNK